MQGIALRYKISWYCLSLENFLIAEKKGPFYHINHIILLFSIPNFLLTSTSIYMKNSIKIINWWSLPLLYQKYIIVYCQHIKNEICHWSTYSGTCNLPLVNDGHLYNTILLNCCVRMSNNGKKQCAIYLLCYIQSCYALIYKIRGNFFFSNLSVDDFHLC